MKTIKITGLFCVLILFSFQAASAHTHKADSLKNLLSQDNNDTVKLNSLIALTDLYMDFDLDSTKIFIDQAEEYISQLNPNHSFFQFYYKKGVYFYKLGNYKDAYSVLLKSAGLADSLGLLHGYFKAKIMLANIQSRMGNQKKAISIGKSLYTLVEKLNNNEIYINYFTNFALYFIYDGQMDTARYYFQKAYTYTKPESYHRAAVAVNLAFLNYKLGQYSKTLQYGMEASAIAKSIHFDELYLEALTNISNAYHEMGEYDLAIAFSEKVMDMAARKKLSLQLENAYGNLSLAYEAQKDYRQALIYQKKYIVLHDSLFNEKMSKQISELEIKYESEKKDKDIAIKQSLIQIKNIELLSLLIGFLFMATAAVFILIFYRKRNKAYMALVQKQLDFIASENRLLDEQKTGEKEKEKYKNSALSNEKKEDLNHQMKRVMQNDKLFLQSDLSLGKLATHFGINSKYLSQTINESYHIGVSDFINQYRINEASRLLVDEEYRHISFEGIAEMVGFGSKSTFNTAFKKFMGVTPSFYLNATKILSEKNIGSLIRKH